MGLFDSKSKSSKDSSPRKVAKDISSGKTENRHIGEKTREVRKQELISHVQNFQETFNAVELNHWKEKLEDLTNKFYRNAD